MKVSAVLCILAATMAAAAPTSYANPQRQNQNQNNNNNNNNNQNQNNQNQNQNNRLSAEEQKYQLSDTNHKIGRSEVIYARGFGSSSSKPVAPEYSEPESSTIYVPENNYQAPKTPKEDYRSEAYQSEEYKTDDIKSKGYQSESSNPEVHQSVDFKPDTHTPKVHRPEMDKPQVHKPEAPKAPAHPVNHVPVNQHKSVSYNTHESYESQTTEQQ
ncbi:hypothetical protein BO85DRAFT_487783 [Aspergillus piperis CBS 112811]|uniref:Uncharacterized protein n=1 Tax=Aspergillus piperis CBS 112811 TaxID=1448313 RepID=A0A8G1R577_9EURO|nr:hypothetical protein BO85DRAFT_487783 [Aspergillus piperis CBS 112811]RAH57960.1 hypothetical protein BO85DRAFT_487783 [Aspergillus piperis CBS 112811]